jgi:hypothetical protein
MIVHAGCLFVLLLLQMIVLLSFVTLCAQVVKVGTSSLVRADKNSFNLSNIARICETVRDLCKAGAR